VRTHNLSLAVFWAGAVAITPLMAQVQWSGTGSAAAQNEPLYANIALERICRVVNGANTYAGTERNGVCHYALQATNETATTYEVATGLGKWEGPGLNGLASLGNLNGEVTRLCRAEVNGVFYAGHTRGTPAFCQIAAPSGFAAPSRFELMYDFNFTGPFQIRNRDSCMAEGAIFPIGSPIGVQFEPCRGTSNFQWRLQRSNGQVKIEHDATPGSCINSSTPNLLTTVQLVACSLAMSFTMTADTDTTFRFRHEASGGNLRRFSNGFQRADPVSVFPGGAGSFEVLTLPEASRRLSVLSYNMMFLPKDQFPKLEQVDRATYIPNALNRQGLLADVVTIQEAFDDDARSRMRLLMGVTYGYQWVSNLPDHASEFYAVNDFAFAFIFPGYSIITNGGVYIASRWPIELRAVHKFLSTSADGPFDTTGLDAFAAKGVSYARINKLGRRYHVFTTHLQAGAPNDEGGIRASQLNEFANFATAMLATAGPNDGIIYTGDYNFDMETDPVGYNLILQRLNAAFVNAPRPPGATSAIQSNRWTVDSGSNEITQERDGGNSFLDYVLVGNQGAQPHRTSYFITQPKHDEEYRINLAVGGLGPSFLTTDVSDHGAIQGRFVFAPVPENIVPPETVKQHQLTLLTTASGEEFPGYVTLDGGRAETPSTYTYSETAQLSLTAPSFLPGPPGFRYAFQNWSPNQPQSFTTALSGPTTYEARYRAHPGLLAEVVPLGGGTVSGIGYYIPIADVPVVATPNPGFEFVRLETPNQSTAASQTVRISSQPVTVRAVFQPTGAPRLSVAPDGSRRYLQNSVVQLGFRMTNSSTHGAVNPRISRILSVTVLSGSGNFFLGPELFANFPTIAPNTTSPYIAPLQIFWPTTAQRIRMTVEITADGGYVTTQTINLTR
jgi:hypothetical protein